MVGDTIVTALNKLKEGIKHRKLIVVLPKSKLLLNILQNFYKRNLISGFKVYGREVDVVLSYRDVSCVMSGLDFEYYKICKKGVKKGSKKSSKGGSSKGTKTEEYNFCTFLFYQTSYGGVMFDTVLFNRYGTGGMLILVVEI